MSHPRTEAYKVSFRGKCAIFDGFLVKFLTRNEKIVQNGHFWSEFEKKLLQRPPLKLNFTQEYVVAYQFSWNFMNQIFSVLCPDRYRIHSPLCTAILLNINLKMTGYFQLLHINLTFKKWRQASHDSSMFEIRYVLYADL